MYHFLYSAHISWPLPPLSLSAFGAQTLPHSSNPSRFSFSSSRITSIPHVWSMRQFLHLYYYFRCLCYSYYFCSPFSLFSPWLILLLLFRISLISLEILLFFWFFCNCIAKKIPIFLVGFLWARNEKMNDIRKR